MFKFLSIYHYVTKFDMIVGILSLFVTNTILDDYWFGFSEIQNKIDSILPSKYFKWDKRIVKLKELEIVIRLLLISIPTSSQKNSPQHRFRFQRLQSCYSEMTVYHLTKYYRIWNHANL
jgi:hypothetical protein